MQKTAKKYKNEIIMYFEGACQNLYNKKVIRTQSIKEKLQYK